VESEIAKDLATNFDSNKKRRENTAEGREESGQVLRRTSAELQGVDEAENDPCKPQAGGWSLDD